MQFLHVHSDLYLFCAVSLRKIFGLLWRRRTEKEHDGNIFRRKIFGIERRRTEKEKVEIFGEGQYLVTPVYSPSQLVGWSNISAICLYNRRPIFTIFEHVKLCQHFEGNGCSHDNEENWLTRL